MKRARVAWSQFKSIIDTYSSNFVYIENTATYELFTFLGQKEIECIIFRDGSADVLAFEASYKAKGNKPITDLIPALPDPDGHRFRGKRIISSTITESQTNLDFVLPEDLFLTGFLIKCFNSNRFDYGKFQIIAPVGHPLNQYPQEILIEEFVSSWGLCDELQMIEVYKAKIYQGLKIRIVYVKDGPNQVDLWVNAFLHKKA